MPKATVETPGKVSKIMWQDDADGIGAQAVLMEGFSDVLKVTQAGNYIHLNYETLPEFIKQLNGLKAEAKK